VSVDAAATLSLKIDTSGAAQQLSKLKEEYAALRAELGKPISAANSFSDSFKGVQASLSSIAGSISAVNKALDDIVRAGGKYTNDLVKGARAATQENALLTNSLTSVAAARDRLVKSAVAYDSLMGVGSTKAAVEANTLLTASLTAVAREYDRASVSAVKYDALNLVKGARAATQENALLTNSLTSVAAARDRLVKSAVAYDSLMGVGSTKAAVEANTLLTASLTAVAREYDRASVSAVKYDALMGSVAAKTSSRANALLTTSAIAPFNPTQVSASGTYDALMNSVAGSKPGSAENEAANAHKNLANAVQSSSAHQKQWNDIAQEGHTVARGLAGSLGQLWLTYGSLLPLLAGGALGAAFKQTAVLGADFEHQLTFVKALGDETSETMSRISEAARGLGKNSLQGPVELASGFRILAQAGLSGSDSILAMVNTMDLATVGEMRMEEAGIALAGVMNAFSLNVTDMARIGDVFAKAAALSQTSVEGMTAAMRTASVVGEMYGASMEDTATALTLLAKVNITGTAAGTAFRNMLKELYAPGKQAAELMKMLGLSTKDAAGNLRSFPDTIYALRPILEQYNKSSQVNILQKLFGERGAKEAIAMLALTRKQWEDLNKSISDSQGFMRNVSSQLEQTTKGTFAQAINALKTSLVDVFDSTGGSMKDLAVRLKSVFSSDEFKATITSLVGVMANLVSGLITATSVVVNFFKAIPDGTANVVSMGLAMGATALAVTSLVSKVAAAANSLATMAAAGSLALGPIGAIALGVGALAAAYVLFNSKTPDSIQNINALNAALDTEISRLQIVNNELLKKIGLESGSANSSVSSAKLALATAKADLADAKALVEEQDNSLKQGKTTVIGNMLDNLFTTDEAQRAKYAKTREARVNMLNLEKSVRQAELKVSIAEGYEIETSRNANKARTQQLIKDQEAAAALKTGAKNYDPNDKSGKDFRALLNDQLSAGLKKEQLQLKRDLLGVDIQATAQMITEEDAQRAKNELEEASLENQKKIIEQSLQVARRAGDKLEIQKIQNKLDENAIQMEDQKYKSAEALLKLNVAQNNAIDDAHTVTARYIEDLEFEQRALSLTADEVERLRIETEKTRAIEDIDLAEKRNKLSKAQADAARKDIEDKAAAKQADADYRSTFEAGWDKAYKDWTDNATNAAKTAADEFKIMTDSMENFMDNFLTSGKLGFADFAKSVILNIAKIEARALLAKYTSEGGGGFLGAIGSFMKSLMGGSSFEPSVGTTNAFMQNGVGIASMGTSLAYGGVVGGSPSLHRYANTVRDTPTSFAFANLYGFAKGGVFAEAGPEAVMPLGRDSRGRLGVRTLSGAGDSTHITMNIYGMESPSDVRRSATQGMQSVLNVMRRAQRHG